MDSVRLTVPRLRPGVSFSGPGRSRVGGVGPISAKRTEYCTEVVGKSKCLQDFRDTKWQNFHSCPACVATLDPARCTAPAAFLPQAVGCLLRLSLPGRTLALSGDGSARLVPRSENVLVFSSVYVVVTVFIYMLSLQSWNPQHKHLLVWRCFLLMTPGCTNQCSRINL